jgi:hypothetical protein
MLSDTIPSADVAMTCLMAYHNKKRTEARSIMLQGIVNAATIASSIFFFIQL